MLPHLALARLRRSSPGRTESGGGGIRTHGTLTGPQHFECCALGRTMRPLQTCRHGNSLRFRRVLSGALGVPCTRNPLMRDRIPARGRLLFRRQRARGDESRVPYGKSFVNRVRSGRKQL